MIIKPKKNIKFLNRSGHWIKKSRKGYLTMERNERVDEFSNTQLKKIFNNLTSYDLRTYPENNEIYFKISKWLKIKPENIMLTEGADGGLLRVFNVFISEKDRVVALNPSFSMYPLYCKMFNGKYLPFNLNLETQKNYFKEFVKFIKKTKPKLVLISNPNQPVEVMLNFEQLKSICEITEKMNCLFLVDEAYYHYNKISAQKLVKKFKNLIVVRTFSKAFGLAGLRVGYSIADKNIIDLLKSIKPIYEINSINIKIINYFLDNIPIMKKNVKEINKSKKYIKKELKKLNIDVYGKYSNTVLIKLRNSRLAKNMCKKLFNRKIIVRQMAVEKNENFIRCTLGSLKLTKLFLNQFKNIYKKYV